MINEIIVEIVGNIGAVYGDIIEQPKIRQIVEQSLYNYNITPKETLPAVIDDMREKIFLYLATKKTEGLSDKSIQHYGRILVKFSNYIRKNAVDITAMDIRVYIAKYSQTGVKNTTIASHTDVLRGFFNWLDDEKYIPESPAKRIKSPKVEKRLRKALTKEEFEILRTGAKTFRQKALLEFLYSTGCRLEEAETVKKQDIDWQSLQVKIIGKGNKERITYINASCLVHLRKYLMSRLDDSDCLFVTQKKPIKFLGKRAIQREIDVIMGQSGLKKNVFPHLIRHTFGTHMLNNGMSLTVLQEIMGHDSPETTLVYAKVNNHSIEQEYRKYS